MFQTLISIAFIFGVIVRGSIGTAAGIAFLMASIIWLIYSKIAGISLQHRFDHVLDIYLDVEFIGLVLWVVIHFWPSQMRFLYVTCLIFAVVTVLVKRIGR